MMKPCIVFDLDGTLADVRHRLHFVRQMPPPDWQAFFDACVDDPHHEYVVTLNTLIGSARASNVWPGEIFKHDQTFRSQLLDILRGDDNAAVDVMDLRAPASR